MEFSPNGPPNIPEFGTVKNEAGFSALYAMDAYEHVVPERAIPRVMLITGYNDPRVSSWELAKFAARLAGCDDQRAPDSACASTTMRVTASSPLRASRASSCSPTSIRFLLWQCGDPDFAGTPTRIYPRQPSL